jgi:SAM-dependent methyltransferase
MFTLFVKNILVDYFKNKNVLDVGSGDINGNNGHLFENCSYTGNDVIEAPNVSIVSKTKDLPFENNCFDTIISTECFEHDPEYTHSLLKIYNMLKPGGLFVFTCAGYGRPEHGTRRTSPENCFGTIGNLEDMMDYYKNLTIKDINDIKDLNSVFSTWNSYYNAESCDLYFVGIKRGLGLEEWESEKRVLLAKYSNEIDIYNISSQSNCVLTSIVEIFNKYNTDKNSGFHNYSRQYETLFKDFRTKPLRYLEIGVYCGGSINAMKEIFVKSQLIVGLDIDPNCKYFENAENNLFIDIGDATNPAFIETIKNKYSNFDIILDDGSHINKDVITTFELLFPMLNDGGIYIVEDTICYKSETHLDKKYPNHIQYFFNYLHYLNQWRFDSTAGQRDHCIDPFKIIKKTSNLFEYSIDKIEFGCSYIAIYKKTRNHWIAK